ncbi:MAG: hypothetical protein LC790_12460, partial [Actinobacteria bacterium]|nr:hypothetical protein [Actinomycetota bacterium]
YWLLVFKRPRPAIPTPTRDERPDPHSEALYDLSIALATYQTYHDVPQQLANRLDELHDAAGAAARKPKSIERAETLEQLRRQFDGLLKAYRFRDNYTRIRGKLHAGHDGLRPISDDRRLELTDLATRVASERDQHVAQALEAGATLQDAVLAAGITLDEARAIVHKRETTRGRRPSSTTAW